MTEVIFVSVFFLVLGYFASKFFKGLNPFKMVLGFAIVFPVSLGLIEANNNWYTGLFIGGILLNFGNPFGSLFGAFEDYKLHRMYQKSLNNQKSNIENELNEKVDNTSRYYQQKEDDIRRQEEELRRKQREFERNRTNGSNNDEYRQDNRTPMEILGLRAGFTPDDLKKAYKRESLKYHPDKVRHKPPHIKKMMEEEYKKVMNAYSKLKK